MKWISSLLASLLLVLATEISAQSPNASAAASDPAANLSSVIQVGEFETGNIGTLGPKRSRGKLFRPNPELNLAKAGSRLGFTTPGGKTISIPVRRAHQTEHENRYVSASEGIDSYFRAVILDDGNFVGSLLVDGVAYEARIESGETIFYSSAAGELAPEPFLNDTGFPTRPGKVPQYSDPEALGRIAETAQLSDQPTVLTVGILYDSEMAGWDPLARLAWIDLLMQTANEVYQDSGVDLIFAVLDVAPYEPGVGKSISERLSYISCGTYSCLTGSGSNTTVDSWRDTIGADLVVQLTGTGSGGTCGIALLPYFSTDSALLPRYAYSVSAYSNGNSLTCPSVVVAHEIGHNLTLWHDRALLASQGNLPPYPAVFDYGFGHVVQNGLYGTTMSYPGGGFDFYLSRLSNPDITFLGEPLGVPIDQPNPAFSALAVDVIAPSYEDIYDNANLSLAPPAPVFVDLLSTGASSIELDFVVDRGIGQPAPDGVTAQCGNKTATGTSSPLTVTGLSSGTTYECFVRSSNQYGTSPSSNTLEATTLVEVTPSSSAGGTISPDSVQVLPVGASVQFVLTPESGNFVAGVAGTCGGSLSTLVFTIDPVSTNCSVQVEFAEKTPPSAPAVTSVEAENASLLVRFTIPDDGGSPITGYTVTCGGISASGADSPITVPGLANDQEYSCSVVATNAVGSSQPSAPVSGTPEEAAAGLPIWLLYEATKE